MVHDQGIFDLQAVGIRPYGTMRILSGTAIYHKKLTFGQGYFHGQKYLRRRRIASNEEREATFCNKFRKVCEFSV